MVTPARTGPFGSQPAEKKYGVGFKSRSFFGLNHIVYPLVMTNIAIENDHL